MRCGSLAQGAAAVVAATAQVFIWQTLHARLQQPEQPAAAPIARADLHAAVGSAACDVSMPPHIACPPPLASQPHSGAEGREGGVTARQLPDGGHGPA